MKRKNVLKFMPLAALFFLASCGGETTKNETQTETVKKNVKVEEVRLTPVDQLSTFTATVEANTVNNIAPAMGGRIRSIHVDVGSRVGKGQTVVTMDAANYSQQQTQLATLKRDYERYLELYNVGGISKQQLDQVKAQLDVAQTALNNLGENTRLTSPINGVVTVRNYDPGDMAGGQPILTIENINPVKVIINVSESFYSQVVKGMPAKVQVDALSDEVFEGKVSLIHPTLNPVSHTFPVEIEVNNSDQRLRPGMFSRVTMNFGTNDRPLVPDMAVLKQTGSNDRYVFVEKDGKAVYTLVQLGTRIEDKYEIVSGLSAGDRVIVQGNAGLIDGTEVEVVE
ncbi:MAG: efflux RND transporter periplasmic adaptor subunit [Petrimonas sp.]|jgi:RND family efflux transporter MFP subunit|uniref:efflux RND transporter periplasmic adaptor subunit n=1 Tax=Petrimonas sp. TaxID=2023866 RepID=UPI000E956748|nr:efflux RND transporter periplasmic adaptor subunit [Petrimonas sp.]NLU30644.1 efflux RND transporter periplasmic adaptor subunit [Bacteroidales bacterium]HBC38516.1 efflux transporter periplasmic adaptor subunit [Porphyromonadaceae bacterium]MDD4536328.1 efflux RND transporter periplasmic adaptor subunit [Petrimonas sp.]HBK41466.1 efflux transporter periplasmic adaptor subunit [Porphyromonadaceae bacterium]